MPNYLIVLGHIFTSYLHPAQLIIISVFLKKRPSMRLLSALLVIVILIIGSSAIITRDRAEQVLQEIDTIGETNNPKLLDRKAILANDLALFYQSIGDKNQAIVFSKQAIKYTEDRINIENVWTPQNLQDLQDLYLNLARIQGTAGYIANAQNSILDAEVYFLRLKQLVNEKEVVKNATYFYGAAFAIAFHANEFELAESYGIKALRNATVYGEPGPLSEAHRNLGELYKRMGDSQRGLESINSAIAALQNADATSDLPQNLIQSKIGTLYNSKRYGDVIDFMIEIPMFSSSDQLNLEIQKVSVSEYSGILDNIFIFSYAYIRLYQQNGDKELLKRAQEWQNEAYTLAEYALVENGVDRLGQVISSPEIQITSTLKNYELLEQEGALSQSDIGQLLRTIDVYHATQLHFNRLKTELNAENWSRQKSLRVELETIFKTLQNTAKDDLKFDSLQNVSFQLSTELATLAASTKRDEIAKEYQLGQQEFLNQLNNYSIRTKKTILTYFWSKRLSRLYIIGRNPSHYFFKSVEVDAQFLPLINESYQLNAHFLVNPKDLKRQDSLNCKLYEVFINPVKKELTTQHLLVYPIGPMSYVSIDALRPDPSSYLIEGFNTSYTSSLFALLRQKKSKEKLKTVSAFYPKHYGNDSLAELFHAKNEISTIDSCTATKTFEGKNATKEEFLSQKGSSRILHVASHSILDSENPYNSYLIFEEKDSSSAYHLKASEIFTKSFDSDLIVLSSCNSAKGNVGEEIGIISLSNAFYFSGIPATLGSLWSAQDNSSSKIISDFYRNIFKNQSKSLSLSNAKRDYLSKADALKSQPFFWANYVMYGSDAPIIMNAEDNNWSVTFFVILLIMIVPFAIYKRARRSLA